jgi:hypothetical protein
VTEAIHIVSHVSPLWFACEEAERPPDPYVMWHYRDCAGCALKASVIEHMHPNDPSVEKLKRLMGWGET